MYNKKKHALIENSIKDCDFPKTFQIGKKSIQCP